MIRVRLNRLLIDREMTLTSLAARVGVSLENLSRLKTGKARAIRFSTLDALCRALACTPGDLLAHEEKGAGKPRKPKGGPALSETAEDG